MRLIANPSAGIKPLGNLRRHRDVFDRLPFDHRDHVRFEPVALKVSSPCDVLWGESFDHLPGTSVLRHEFLCLGPVHPMLW